MAYYVPQQATDIICVCNLQNTDNIRLYKRGEGGPPPLPDFFEIYNPLARSFT